MLALTGGLAAPALAGGVAALGLGGAAGGAAAVAVGSTAVVGTTFGAAGATVAGYKMSRRTGGLANFEFATLREGPLLAVVCINGWVREKGDFSAPFQPLVEGDHAGDPFGGAAEISFLEWETEALLQLGSSLYDVVKNQALGFALKKSIQYTAMAGLAAALAAPATIVAAAGTIDNVWGTTMDKAKRGGALLARTLMDRAQGGRPVILVGMSLGARMVFACLEELDRAGEAGRGLVHHAVLVGAPCASDAARWAAVRRAVAGRLVNAYSRNDWLLAALTRFTHWGAGSAAGLAPVECAGVRNVDLSNARAGRGDYSSQAMAHVWPALLGALDEADAAFPAGGWADLRVGSDSDDSASPPPMAGDGEFDEDVFVDALDKGVPVASSDT